MLTSTDWSDQRVDTDRLRTSRPAQPRGGRSAPRGTRPSWLRRIHPLTVIVGLVLAAVLAVVIVIPMGFVLYGATRSGTIGDPESTFSWKPLATLFETNYLVSFGGTILMGLVVAAISVAVGTVFAWLLARTDMPMRKFFEVVVIGTLFLSPFIGAVAWLTLAAPNSGMLNVAAEKFLGATSPIVDITTPAGVVFVMCLYFLPYAYLFVSSSLKGMDPSYEEASYMSGKGVLKTALTVTIPLVRPALVSAFFLITILSIGVFAIPAVLGGYSGFAPVSVLVFRAVDGSSNYALAAAIGVGVVVLAIIGTLLYRMALRSANRFTTITARGFRPRVVRIRGLKTPALVVCFVYLLLAIVLPNLALLIISFTPYIQTDVTDLTFTTDYWISVLTNRRVLGALGNTLMIGLIVPTITVAIAILVSYIVERTRWRFRRVIDVVAVLPVAVPGIVFATGFVWAYVGSPIYATIWILVFAFVGSHIPHATRAINASLVQIDPALEEAARVNGAGRGRMLGRITLPLTMPSILAGWILVFLLVTRDVNTAIMLYSPRTTILPVLTWNFVQDGDMRSAAVVGILETVMLLAIVVLARLVFRVRLTSIVGRETM